MANPLEQHKMLLEQNKILQYNIKTITKLINYNIFLTVIIVCHILYTIGSNIPAVRDTIISFVTNY